MNLMFVLLNCFFTLIVYVIMSRKVRKSREMEVLFRNYVQKLDAFSTLVEKFLKEVAMKEGLDIISLDIKPKFDGISYDLIANAAILDKKNTTSRCLLFTIYNNYPLIDSRINSNSFFEERTEGWKNRRRVNRKHLFEDWLTIQYSTREVEALNGIEFKTLLFEVNDNMFESVEVQIDLINKEYKEAMAILDRSVVSKNLSSIKRRTSNLIKLTEDVDDIDICVAISEFDENTDTFLEVIADEMDKDLDKANKKSLEYLSSIDVIRKHLKTFLLLKEKGTLSNEEEIKLQNDIDNEISKWNNFIKGEA